MFKVLILICAVGIERDACTQDTALDIVKGPQARSMSQCMHESQSTLAQTALVPEPGKQYLKIICQSEKTS